MFTAHRCSHRFPRTFSWYLFVAAVFLVATLGHPVVAAGHEPPDVALQLQNAFTGVAESAMPAVVVITNLQTHSARNMDDGIPPELRRFFGLPPTPEQRQPERQGQSVPQPAGRGSGLILSPDGYIVTNYHVVRESDALEVKLNDGRVFNSAKDQDAVEIVGTDEETDLAVLRIGNGELDGLPTLPFADSENPKVGEWAIAVGAPFNLDNSVTVGVVSQIGRYDMRINTYENYIQTDASINPGNSGGPLLNIRGEVIGINDFIMTGSGMSRGNIGIGFAIASNLVSQIVEDLIENNAVIRPWLGIAMQELTPELKGSFQVDEGVLINEVMDGDPADKAGLKAGDVILKVGKKTVRTPHDVQFAVLAYEPGEEIPLRISRNGKEKLVSVVPRRKDKDGTNNGKDSAPQDGDLLGQTGLQLETTNRGVVVAGVRPGSPADANGIQRGDRVIGVNRQEVDSQRDVEKALKKTHGNMAILYLDRKGRKFFVPLKIADE